MAKKLTDDQIRTFQQYGLNVKEIAQQREFPGFDFSIFEGMDDRYYQIRSEYLKLKSNPDYSNEYKEKQRQAALHRIDILKAEYYTDAMTWIDKTYRKPKAKQKPYLTTDERMTQELELNRQLTVLTKQLEIEPAEKLLELYHKYKDKNEEAVTLIELELRQRKDIPGGDPAAIEAWTELEVDRNGGEIVAQHWENKIKSVLNIDASWFPVGLENGFEAAKYEEIEL